MSNVIYRDLRKEDYNAIKFLIGDAFGFNEFISDKKFLNDILNIYLQDCILASSFGKVAEKDNKVIGIILGKAKDDNTNLRKFHNLTNIASTMFKLLISKKENKKVLKEFSKIHNTYDELIKGKKCDFQGCIQLFIVSKESRGLGVGKALVSQLFNYMNKMDVKSLYLYTDTKCNYGFYDSQNFNRLNEKKVSFDAFNYDLDIFLYGYKL
ncbi:GNAT family N-acetyltransferase [Clostridium cadaveris]|uniref:GNAT family N-acetyltransferase n=1 Tax=Clostridium cadaveris TaxID=1529 RepID=UPI000C07B429|nr:GNAT family N-acetyltransferase [Clostridium cadaveris]